MRTDRSDGFHPCQSNILRSIVISGIVASASFGALAPAAAQDKPNILFIMGDDIGWMQPSIYHQGCGRRNTEYRSHWQRGCEVYALLRRAELYGWT
jgi:hypothetical protein